MPHGCYRPSLCQSANLFPPVADPAVFPTQLHPPTDSWIKLKAWHYLRCVGDGAWAHCCRHNAPSVVTEQIGLEPACSTDPMASALMGLRWPMAFPRQGDQATYAGHDGHLALMDSGLSTSLTTLQGPWGPACTRLGWTRVDGARWIASIRSPGLLSLPKMLFLIGIIYKCIEFLFLLF